MYYVQLLHFLVFIKILKILSIEMDLAESGAHPKVFIKGEALRFF
jgi:hypothetical protein